MATFTITVSRAFDAPPERVFDAWLDRQHVGEWLFATPTGLMVGVELDPRVGGRYTLTDRRDGQDIAHTGTYLAMERPDCLEFTLSVPFYAADIDHIRIEIDSTPEGSFLRLIHTTDERWADQAENTRQGWTGILDALAARLT